MLRRGVVWTLVARRLSTRLRSSICVSELSLSGSPGWSGCPIRCSGACLPARSASFRILVQQSWWPPSDPGLLRIIARAHDFQERLLQDPNLTVPAIASQERLTIGYLSRLLRLPSLAPDIVTAIINNNHPPQFSAKWLMHLPLSSLPTGPNSGSCSGFRSDNATPARAPAPIVSCYRHPNC